MGEMRFVLLVVLVVVGVLLVKRALRNFNKPDAAQKPAIEGELVACARCGLNLPRTEAREARGRLFCGEEHARLGPG